MPLQARNLKDWAESFKAEIGPQIKPELENTHNYSLDYDENGYKWSIYKSFENNKLYLVLKDNKGYIAYGKVNSGMEGAPLPKQMEGISNIDLKWSEFLSKLMWRVYVLGETFEEVLTKWGEEKPEISLAERKTNPQLNNFRSDPDAFFED